MWLLLKPGPGPWTRTLKTLKNLINMALNNLSDFRELFFITIMRNVLFCLKVRLCTDD